MKSRIVRPNYARERQKPNLSLHTRPRGCIMPAPASAFNTFLPTPLPPCRSRSSWTASAPSPGCATSRSGPSKPIGTGSAASSSSTGSATPRRWARRRCDNSCHTSPSRVMWPPRPRTWRCARCCSFIGTCFRSNCPTSKVSRGLNDRPACRSSFPAGRWKGCWNLVIGMTGSLIAAVAYDYARNRYQLYKRQRRFTLQVMASNSKEMFRAFLKKVGFARPALTRRFTHPVKGSLSSDILELLVQVTPMFGIRLHYRSECLSGLRG